MLRSGDFEQFRREPGLGFDDDDDGVLLAGRLTPLAEAATRAAAVTDDVPASDEDDLQAVAEDLRPDLVEADCIVPHAGLDLGPLAASQADSAVAQAARADIDPARILRDRPDVHAAFYSEFYGPNNDRNSPAWHDRVGGETAEDFARYWYKTHGQAEGYVQPQRSAAAPAEGYADPAPGRTTGDGIALSKILSDRPDVFQAFFTEYYGPNNDRNSDAWVERVGGATVEDYANYWYNAHGKVSGYAPSGRRAAAETPDAVGAPTAPEEAGEPHPAEDPSLDPWNHPAIYPDWQPPYPGWRPPSDGSSEPVAEAPAAAAEDDYPYARPLIAHFREDGVDLVPATLKEILAMTSLFDDTAI